MALSNDVGLKTTCSFLFGNKYDTPETVKRTVQFAFELRPTIASFNVMIPFPGTEAFAETFGCNLQTNWSEFIIKGKHVLSKVDGLTDRRLKRFHACAFWRFYGRPIQILRISRHIWNVRELTGYVRAALGLTFRSMEWWFN